MKSKRVIPAQVEPVVMLSGFPSFHRWALLLDGKELSPNVSDLITMKEGGICLYFSKYEAIQAIKKRAEPQRFKPIKVQIIFST